MAAPNPIKNEAHGARGRKPHLRKVDDDHHEDPGMHMMEGAKKGEEGEGPWLVSYADLMTLLMGFFALIASMGKPDIKKVEAVQQSAQEKFGGDFKKPYQELADKIEQVIKQNSLENQVKVTRAADGVTVKFDGTLFFNSGDMMVKLEGKSIIDKILVPIKPAMTGYKAQIEGHTDNVPISHPIIASNWELSAIRAARIAQLFESYGFKKEQLIIMGWGETKPEYPNVTLDGIPIPVNQAKNRRVILKIFNKDAAD